MSIIKFEPGKLEELQALLDTLPEPSDLPREALEEYRQRVQLAIDTLNTLEPKSEGSELYDRWAELHEDLEDALDDLLDCLE